MKSEYLVRNQSMTRYLRIEAQGLLEIVPMLKAQECWMIHSISGEMHQLEANSVLLRTKARLPPGVRIAWWGARHPKIRLGFQIGCWLGLGFALRQAMSQSTGWQFALLIAGIANILMWWWFESERGRLEPGVLLIYDN